MLSGAEARTKYSYKYILINNLRFGISLVLEGLLWPSKTLYKLQATGVQPIVVVRRICLPLLPTIFALGFIGLQLWGKPAGFWNYEHIEAVDAVVKLVPAYLLAVVLIAAVLLNNSKSLKAVSAKLLLGSAEFKISACSHHLFF